MTGKATRDIDEVSGIIIDGNIKLIRIRLAACGEILMLVKTVWPLRSDLVCKRCFVVFFNSLYSSLPAQVKFVSK